MLWEFPKGVLGICEDEGEKIVSANNGKKGLNGQLLYLHDKTINW